jgi:hypothetical protein
MISALIFKGLIFAAIVMSFQPIPKPGFQSDFFIEANDRWLNNIEAIEHMNLDDEEDYINDD